MQTRKHSLLESVVNVFIGYWVALLSQLLIFPYFDVNLPITDNLLIGAFFTIVSIIRSYLIRRLFNNRVNNNPISDMPN
ncbi:hypothetical protein QWY97_17725 [Vibrio cortegadensis]|uniref:DUF7220 family protein n=1 Tax=Vibrio cortegadensis TaxID=1328770 RepID=UPI0021C29F0D|nr:hypothetical protein [Vibrio cortegadensis]MDN3699166.1 hypothetical protein [Vibrio cortegadensis]